MRAINLPYYKERLREVSRELFLEHGWDMPCGLEDSTVELYGLRREAFIAFSTAARGSQQQRNALASMRNIEAELAIRPPGL